MKNKIKEDLIPGGKGDNKSDSDFDPNELDMGIKVELEHTKNFDMAKEIAMDHLSEDPKYYTKLKDSGLADELEEKLRKFVRTEIKHILKEINKLPNLKQWWKEDPEDILRYIYWTKDKLPPNDSNKRKKALDQITNYLKQKYPKK